MTYKPTGNPVGRPKTKEYKTVLARIPADLEALVKRYARQHPGMSVAELIREGLVWRIGDGDPRGMGLYLEESRGMSEKTYYINTETAPGVDNSAMLEDMRAALARQEAQIQTLVQALERQTTPADNGVYSSNTGIEPVASQRAAEQEPEAQPTVLQAAQNPALASAGRPTFDPTRHHLGALCRNKHEWGSSGQSLRNADHQCLECRALAKREKDARKKAARAAQHATT